MLQLLDSAKLDGTSELDSDVKRLSKIKVKPDNNSRALHHVVRELGDQNRTPPEARQLLHCSRIPQVSTETENR